MSSLVCGSVAVYTDFLARVHWKFQGGEEQENYLSSHFFISTALYILYMILWKDKALYWIVWRTEHIHQYYRPVYGVKEGLTLSALYMGTIWFPTEILTMILYGSYTSIPLALVFLQKNLLAFFAAFTLHAIVYRIGYIDYLAYPIYDHAIEVIVD